MLSQQQFPFTTAKYLNKVFSEDHKTDRRNSFYKLEHIDDGKNNGKCVHFWDGSETEGKPIELWLSALICLFFFIHIYFTENESLTLQLQLYRTMKLK